MEVLITVQNLIQLVGDIGKLDYLHLKQNEENLLESARYREKIF